MRMDTCSATLGALRPCIGLALVLGASGCREVTQLYFHIASNLQVPDELDQLSVVLVHDDARFQTAHRLQGPARALDESLSILAGREILGDVLVEVRALQAGRTIADAALAARFQPEERVEVEVWLDPLPDGETSDVASP